MIPLLAFVRERMPAKITLKRARQKPSRKKIEADDGKTVGLTVVGFNFRLAMLVFVFIFDGSRELRFDAGSSPILLTDNRDDCWECMKGDIGADDGAELLEVERSRACVLR